MLKEKLQIIRELAKEYDVEAKQSADCTNSDLKKLVDEHGVEAVSVASGLKITSIVLYTSRTNPPSVSESTISKAKIVLEKAMQVRLHPER